MNTADTRHHLHLIRKHLGDLAAAQHTDPAPAWPPQRLTTEMWAIRDAQAAAERADHNDHALGDAPAPVFNLDAMQAHQDISEALLMLADIVAEACQLRVATEHHADPARWRFNASWRKARTGSRSTSTGASPETTSTASTSGPSRCSRRTRWPGWRGSAGG